MPAPRIHEDVVVVAERRFQALQQQLAHIRGHFRELGHARGCREHVKTVRLHRIEHLAQLRLAQQGVLQRAFRRDAQKHVQIGQAQVAIHEQRFKARLVQCARPD